MTESATREDIALIESLKNLAIRIDSKEMLIESIKMNSIPINAVIVLEHDNFSYGAMGRIMWKPGSDDHLKLLTLDFFSPDNKKMALDEFISQLT